MFKHQLEPHEKDLGGGFLVRRLLPTKVCRSVGPFVFFDHFGPVQAQPDDNHDVRPHPHIGLCTVTYLFEGAMQHADSLGTHQRIEPGAINLMVAGNGITHSERTPDDLKGKVRTSHGLQLWCALPKAIEQGPPAFYTASAASIPQVDQAHATIRVLMGSAYGVTSPVPQVVPALYVDYCLQPGSNVELPAQPELERAIYSCDQALWVNDQLVEPFKMMVLEPGAAVSLRAQSHNVRCVLVGGEPLDGPRIMYWNFVASAAHLIEEAAARWERQDFPKVPGETEFIPLPPGPIPRFARN